MAGPTRKNTGTQSRDERLKQALKSNLARRKAQKKARDTGQLERDDATGPNGPGRGQDEEQTPNG
ncbi:hypothetical protein [Pacificitalea manganoxidans]|uniref:hypothetical protein n=1 Tax=Pacificitalea manganoxidans TaxID=1411902 RepID=UPI0011309D66|nr:hypothetical protein [Pacificitalea manganoxidans]MDR6308947.1 hypothetical protein [Pacificitalea manganoxidans]